MDWLIPAIAGWFLRGMIGGTEKVAKPNVFKGATTLPLPTAKVPDSANALTHLDGIEQRLERDRKITPKVEDAISTLTAAIRGGPANE